MPFVVIILTLIIGITIFDLVKELGFFTNVLTDKTIDAMIIAVCLFTYYNSYFHSTLL